MVYKRLADKVAKLLNRELGYMKSDSGPSVTMHHTTTLDEINSYGGNIERHNGHEIVGTYQGKGILGISMVFDATFRKCEGGNPYWMVVDCGEKINGDPRKPVRGFVIDSKINSPIIDNGEKDLETRVI